MLDRVYILVVAEIQNSSDLNMVSISLSYHLPGYINPGLVWWLYSCQESRYFASDYFDTMDVTLICMVHTPMSC